MSSKLQQAVHTNEIEKPAKVKHYILAKDVLRHDPLSFKKFSGNHVYILSGVLKELRLITESQRKNDIAVFQAKEVLNLKFDSCKRVKD